MHYSIATFHYSHTNEFFSSPIARNHCLSGKPSYSLKLENGNIPLLKGNIKIIS